MRQALTRVTAKTLVSPADQQREAGRPVSQGSWTTPDISPDIPNVARMYDYYLGGFHNFAVDRAAAERALAIYPGLRLVMQANRAFLRRTVRYLLDQGIDQFLDIGSGIPTAGNIHEVAQAGNPQATVVYVDADPVAVAHSQTILSGQPRTVCVLADARRPEEMLQQPEVRRLLRFDRPLGVLALMLLHFVPDDALALHIVHILRAALAPGSFLVLSHATGDQIPDDARTQMTKLYANTSHPIIARSSQQIAQFFDGLQLVPPGLVYLPAWRPEDPDDLLLDDPARSITLGGVAELRQRAAQP
jgi:hypothetical protein